MQDFLERRIAIEIVSYYTPVAPEMTEIAFINAVLQEADCDLSCWMCKQRICEWV